MFTGPSLFGLAAVDATLMQSLLLDVLVKGAVLTALIVPAALLLRRRASAAVRHQLWLLALAGLLVLPALSIALPGWQVVRLPAWTGDTEPATTSPEPSAPVASRPDESASEQTAQRMPSARNVDAPQPDAPPVVSRSEELRAQDTTSETDPVDENEPAAASSGESIASSAATPAASSTNESPPLPWATLIVCIYAAGMALVLVPYVLGHLQLRRLLRHSERAADDAWHNLLAQARRELNIKRDVRLLLSPRAAVPITLGIARPAIILPSEAHTWDRARRHVVLLHELAHVQRFDCFNQLLARFACALHWPNPLAWLAQRRLRVEAERASDDRVLAVGAKSSDYAEHLLQLAVGARALGLANHAALPMARRSTLEGRLLAILDPKRKRKALGRLGAALAVIALAAVLVPIACVQVAEQNDPGPNNDASDAKATSENGPAAAAERFLQAMRERDVDYMVDNMQPIGHYKRFTVDEWRENLQDRVEKAHRGYDSDGWQTREHLVEDGLALVETPLEPKGRGDDYFMLLERRSNDRWIVRVFSSGASRANWSHAQRLDQFRHYWAEERDRNPSQRRRAYPNSLISPLKADFNAAYAALMERDDPEATMYILSRMPTWNFETKDTSAQDTVMILHQDILYIHDLLLRDRIDDAKEQMRRWDDAGERYERAIEQAAAELGPITAADQFLEAMSERDIDYLVKHMQMDAPGKLSMREYAQKMTDEAHEIAPPNQWRIGDYVIDDEMIDEVDLAIVEVPFEQEGPGDDFFLILQRRDDDRWIVREADDWGADRSLNHRLEKFRERLADENTATVQDHGFVGQWRAEDIAIESEGEEEGWAELVMTDDGSFTFAYGGPTLDTSGYAGQWERQSETTATFSLQVEVGGAQEPREMTAQLIERTDAPDELRLTIPASGTQLQLQRMSDGEGDESSRQGDDTQATQPDAAAQTPTLAELRQAVALLDSLPDLREPIALAIEQQDVESALAVLQVIQQTSQRAFELVRGSEAEPGAAMLQQQLKLARDAIENENFELAASLLSNATDPQDTLERIIEQRERAGRTRWGPELEAILERKRAEAKGGRDDADADDTPDPFVTDGAATQPADEWGEANNGVQARLRADKLTWAVGQTPTFQAEIRNTGEGEYTVARAQQLCELELDGKRYTWTGVVRVRSSWLPSDRHYKNIPIALTDNWVKSRAIPGERSDRMVGFPASLQAMLSPGRHRLRVIFFCDGADSHENIVVKSNAIEFEVTAPGDEGDARNPPDAPNARASTADLIAPLKADFAAAHAALIEQDDAEAAQRVLERMGPQLEQLEAAVKGTSAEEVVSKGIERVRQLQQALTEDRIDEAKALMRGLNQAGAHFERAIEQASTQPKTEAQPASRIPAALVGTWELRGEPTADIQAITFYGDDTLVLHEIIDDDGTGRQRAGLAHVDNDVLDIELTDGKREQATFELRGEDVLILRDPAGEFDMTIFDRVPDEKWPATQPQTAARVPAALVGTWDLRGEPAGDTHAITFYGDGTLLLHEIDDDGTERKRSGLLEVDDGVLDVELSSGEREELSFELRGEDVLILRDPAGEFATHVFDRVPNEKWPATQPREAAQVPGGLAGTWDVRGEPIDEVRAVTIGDDGTFMIHEVMRDGKTRRRSAVYKVSGDKLTVELSSGHSEQFRFELRGKDVLILRHLELDEVATFDRVADEKWPTTQGDRVGE